MAISRCNTTVDYTRRELVEHGTAAFPIACYHDDLSRENVPWHWHEELELAIITEGKAIVSAGDKKYTVRDGEGFFINAGILHGAKIAGTENCRFHSLVFHPRLVGGSMDSVFYQDYILPLTENREAESLHLRPQIPFHREILESVESAWQSCTQECAGFHFQVRSALSQAVYLLWRNLPVTHSAPTDKALRNSRRIKLMLQYIHAHYHEPMTVADIARSAALSESECLRCFRGVIGVTPIVYVRQYRIEQAARLLMTTQGQISDIATQCGFQDMSYFTRSFRALKGCTPTVYRNGQGG